MSTHAARRITAAVLPFVANLASGAQVNHQHSGPWSGVIVNSSCTVDEASAELPKCTQKDAPSEKPALYDDTLRQVYILDPADQARGRQGDSVTVSGTLDGKTIQVTSVQAMASIGLAAGQVAPAFTARDQSGREQTLETLKGPKGTVLLFFRSADW